MKTIVNERTKSIIFLVITATMWSLGGLLIKSVDTNPIAIAGVRSGISAVIILAATGKQS
jgi:drug/metabolite transporter (DMT)-like permease